jgi:hypothetical protein
MPGVVNPPTTTPNLPVWKSKAPTLSIPLYASEEISAYIAIRDELLAEAEQVRTRAKVESLGVANEFVARCLKPARGPYRLQCLPETEAKRERQRCEAVRHRIAELRVQA